jgi:hypothetical protein
MVDGRTEERQPLRSMAVSSFRSVLLQLCEYDARMDVELVASADLDSVWRDWERLFWESPDVSVGSVTAVVVGPGVARALGRHC